MVHIMLEFFKQCEDISEVRLGVIGNGPVSLVEIRVDFGVDVLELVKDEFDVRIRLHLLFYYSET